jgi:hypothetical protein
MESNEPLPQTVQTRRKMPMEEQITKIKILESIHSEHEALDIMLKQLTDAQMTQSGVENNWSVKDILAHITDWEKRMVQWIEESLQGQTPEQPAPGMTWDDLDKLNEQTYLANKDRPLSAVLTEFDDSYQQSLKVVEALTEEELLDPNRFEWRGGKPLWYMIAANTWEHYQEHRETISNWLEKRQS